MKHLTTTLKTMAALAALLCLCSCGNRETAPEDNRTTETGDTSAPAETVKPMSDYRQEAEQEITEENAEEELQRLQKEIESETGAE